jgi:hypothetical protein
VLPLLNKKNSIGNFIGGWCILIFGSLTVGWLMAVTIVRIGPRLEIMEPVTYQAIAGHVTKSDNWTNFASSILEGG